MNDLKSIVYENRQYPVSSSVQHLLTITPHLHKEIELVYVIEGECVAIADRGRFSITAGDLYIAFPNQVHFYEHCAQGRYIVSIISCDIMPYLSTAFRENIPAANALSLSENDPLRGLFMKLCEAKGEYRLTELCGYMNLIMSRIMPRLTLHPNNISDSSSLRNILNYCSANYMNNPTLDDAAAELHISKYHISHMLNGRLKLSFTDYLNTLRVDAACEALINTEQRIADISEDVGFGTIRSFNRSFKEITGMTPLEYRKEYQEKS